MKCPDFSDAALDELIGDEDATPVVRFVLEDYPDAPDRVILLVIHGLPAETRPWVH